MNKLGLIFLFLFSYQNYVLGQDSLVRILTLDGKIISTTGYNIDPIDSSVVYFIRNGDLRKIDPEFVYSITSIDGHELIFYKPDNENLTYSAEEMKYFIQGENYSREHYKAHWAFVSGMAVGSGLVFSMGSLNINYFYAPVLSLGHVGLAGWVPMRDKKLNIPQEYTEIQPFKEGYKTQSLKKRMRNTAFGAIVGIVGSMIIYNQTLR